MADVTLEFLAAQMQKMLDAQRDTSARIEKIEDQLDGIDRRFQTFSLEISGLSRTARRDSGDLASIESKLEALEERIETLEGTGG